MLLRHRANPNIANRAGDTPLIEASRRNRRAIAMKLLEHGADPSVVSRAGENAMDLAIRHDHTGIVHVLRSVEAQPHAMRDVSPELLKSTTARALADGPVMAAVRVGKSEWLAQCLTRFDQLGGDGKPREPDTADFKPALTLAAKAPENGCEVFLKSWQVRRALTVAIRRAAATNLAPQEP